MTNYKTRGFFGFCTLLLSLYRQVVADLVLIIHLYHWQ